MIRRVEVERGRRIEIELERREALQRLLKNRIRLRELQKQDE